MVTKLYNKVQQETAGFFLEGKGVVQYKALSILRFESKSFHCKVKIIAHQKF